MLPAKVVGCNEGKDARDQRARAVKRHFLSEIRITPKFVFIGSLGLREIPGPGTFGFKKRTLNSPFQKRNFSSSWLAKASDAKHLHSNPPNFKHFPF